MPAIHQASRRLSRQSPAIQRSARPGRWACRRITGPPQSAAEHLLWDRNAPVPRTLSPPRRSRTEVQRDGTSWQVGADPANLAGSPGWPGHTAQAGVGVPCATRTSPRWLLANRKTSDRRRFLRGHPLINQPSSWCRGEESPPAGRRWSTNTVSRAVRLAGPVLHPLE